MGLRRSPDHQLMVALDETALLTHGDTVARALRTWVDEAIDQLEEEHDLFDAPETPSAHSRWVADLSDARTQALAQVEQLRTVRARVYLAWAEDRWADLGQLGSRYRQHLPAQAVEAARRLCEIAQEFPSKGRAPQPRQSLTMPPVREGVQVPWGVDPDAPVTGRSPLVSSRRLWALLREAFPEAPSSRCTVTAHRIQREVARAGVGPRDAMALRKEIASALGAAGASSADEYERQRAQCVESVLSHVVVPLADERDRLAAAVADVHALHDHRETGRCPACGVPGPCPTNRALGSESGDAA
ncbi:hypothetical protein [Streptomyces sp. NPDC058268]|uniref:hypothetical protein n=2 Tax=unclassified Streptomyces TaxID=2593676 RepID=UPI0036EFA216